MSIPTGQPWLHGATRSRNSGRMYFHEPVGLTRVLVFETATAGAPCTRSARPGDGGASEAAPARGARLRVSGMGRFLPVLLDAEGGRGLAGGGDVVLGSDGDV